MAKLELLSAFLNERLTAAADEIFRAVKDTVAEYQSEALRSQQENQRLRRLLNTAVQRLLLHPDPQHQEDELLCESDWGRCAEPLAPVKQEPDVRKQPADSPPPPRHSEEGTCSHLELPRSVPPSSHSRSPTLPPPPPLPPAPSVKTEDGGVVSNCRLALSQLEGAKTPLKGPPRLTSRHSAHLLQVKNVRSLKAPPPRLAHPGPGIQRWHSCKECGKGFSFACQLEVHMRWHTKEKPYSCAVCRKSFTTVSMLKRHHRIHTGEKPFRCHVCGKCFNQSAHLNTHFRLHTRERAVWSRASHCK